MKKVKYIFLGLVMITILSGCQKKNENNVENIISTEKMQTIQSTEKKDNNTEKSNNEKLTNDTDKTTLGKIKTAITSGKKMECTYNTKEDGKFIKMKTYFDGKKYKNEIEFNGEKAYSVFDGQNSYSWAENSAEGTKINMDCLKEFETITSIETTDENENDTDKNDVSEMFDGAMDLNCHNIKTIDFSIPNDIKFIDQCEMLKKQRDLIKNM